MTARAFASPDKGLEKASVDPQVLDWAQCLAAMPAARHLVESTTPKALRERLIALLCQGPGLVWANCLYLDGSGRWLGLDGSDAQFDCSDFGHPYAHVIRSGKSLSLSVRDARARLDCPAFQAQVAALDGQLRLQVRPLRAANGARTWLGALALVGESESVRALAHDEGLAALEALTCQLWHRLTQQQGERQRSQVLKDSLAKLNEGARRQALAERLAGDLLGGSAAMQLLRKQMVRAAETNLAVLVQGETGTGKDRVARAIHGASQRAQGPFMAINCAAIPETLLESELFGHEKGAFSGADQARDGLISQADGGTLFLDEIGDMPMALQAKLLRVLESGRYRPLGASEERRADLRLIAATHQPLRERIQEKRFRADLYYRLGQFPLQVPTLAERRDDIALLTDAFIADFCSREARPPMGITPAALRQLKARHYPGNVRELKNLIDYACAMTPSGGDIEAYALPGEQAPLGEALADGAPVVGEAALALTDDVIDLRQTLREVEAAIIRQRLQRFDGNRTQAAESLGLPKRTLAHKCRLLELDSK
ncbi:sigma-54 interaction domain-containing protein [Halomonas dongshanensis]|uniref:Sigma-54 dependent transcriptional regulator n=1 Tax=Halomonas dongshanensis TaxID=2890835 RepID=A0ABT2EGT8_9GAMM|nr:sigma-54 dependent transcriptional regulator [Halomonas dongshanensis]MCS2610812.1 sigma-54 dependent transcriptional regulator [Halomonas dongshanensis]